MKIAILIFIVAFGLHGQELTHNSTYIECAGNGGLYSLNYERIIDEQYSVRIGGSYANFSHSLVGLNYASFPLLANYFLFSKRSQLELGAGVVFVVNRQNSWDMFRAQAITGTSYLGYRDEDDESHLLFRIGCSQFYSSDRIYFGGGLSFGFVF